VRVRRVRAEEKLTRERVDEKLVLSEWENFFTVLVGDLDRGERDLGKTQEVMAFTRGGVF
jgi:hypothetical protein|tara:strand:+ start:3452 stop:3631 length:180 start_codon:yes stop_codon:yes gene_type:complete